MKPKFARVGRKQFAKIFNTKILKKNFFGTKTTLFVYFCKKNVFFSEGRKLSSRNPIKQNEKTFFDLL